ncbi:TIGR02117 family protein [Qipengyuania zhejiangensis]|uniref:TIGR02117 family protein n=1 Tax=Qipengyuania zhejiangensis TaxID=3077782 RepID=UPI002D76C0AE|nr:TIGR02117 family protein [Qipengyuania sp. Z2]
MNRWQRALTLTIGGVAALSVAFPLSAWIGSSIPRNPDWREPDSGVEIMVETNGIHTAIVMPLVTPQKDWRGDFPVQDLADDSPPYTHVSVSWGERAVFLETPTWADLRPSSAFNAAIGSEGLLHVAHYVRPAPANDIRTLRVTAAQYDALVAAIERQVADPRARRSFAGYGSFDVFYAAPGTYHLGNTCNQWTSDTLAEAGIRTGLWTPLPGGVMKWVPESCG